MSQEKERAQEDLPARDATAASANHGCSAAPARPAAPAARPAPQDPFIRAANEDDDGYDPYSDRRPDPEPLFERDPWG